MFSQAHPSYELAAQEDRCSPRTRTTMPAKLRVSGGRAFHTVLHDLSISGFSASAISRLHPGQICWIRLPGLAALQAEVIWWDNGIVGCALNDLLSPIIYEDLLRRYCPEALYPDGH